MASAAPAIDLQAIPVEQLSPGLIATYRSVNAAATGRGPDVVRVEAKPALTIFQEQTANESLFPDLSPGAFEAEWSGFIEIREPGPIRWSASVAGEVEVRVDDTLVLRGLGTEPSKRLIADSSQAFAPGQHRFEVRYRSAKSGEVSRLQLGWEGHDFAFEPLPAWRLRHRPSTAPDGLAQSSRLERGREVVRTFGCAQCHRDAFPDVEPTPPGPSLHDAGLRLTSEWVADSLMKPRSRTNAAAMPHLFASTPEGVAEARLVAAALVRDTGGNRAEGKPVPDHRPGRNSFLGIGCFACHFVPDIDAREQSTLVPRIALSGLADRFNVDQLSQFLLQPGTRYPDGRMPTLVTSAGTARELAAYLLTYAGASTNADSSSGVARPADHVATRAVLARLGVEDTLSAGRRLIGEKGCAQCHPGLGKPQGSTIAIRRVDAGCLGPKDGPRFSLTEADHLAVAALLDRPVTQRHPSAIAQRRWQLDRAGCVRCHARDTESQSPLEIIARDLWTSHVARLPYQRTPSLSQVLSKYRVGHVLEVVRNGATGIRPGWYSYRMPAYGAAAGALTRALAEADGELLNDPSGASESGSDELVTPGLTLSGFDGYGCVACHLWKGRSLSEPDPSAVGPDLASVAKRIRKDWFDRWLEDPQRVHPGTPMPSFFPRNTPPSQREILGGDAVKQKTALWAYLSHAETAPAPEPRPSEPVALLPALRGPLVAQIPIELPGRGFVETVSILSAVHDLVVFEVGAFRIEEVLTGAAILRNPNGNRSYSAVGKALPRAPFRNWALVSGTVREEVQAIEFRGFQRRRDEVQLEGRLRFVSGSVDVV